MQLLNFQCLQGLLFSPVRAKRALLARRTLCARTPALSCSDSSTVSCVFDHKKTDTCGTHFSLVDATGFEPATSASRTQRSTKLSHASIAFSIKLC